MNDDAAKLLISVGIIAMLVMASFVVLFVAYYNQRQLRQRELLRQLEEKHQRELLEASLQSQEAERRRIATDLHDDIGTMLSATRMSLSQASRHAGDNPAVDAVVRQTRQLLEETVNNVRRITKELLPATLEQLGLVAALQEFIAKLRQTSPNVGLDLTHEGFEETPDAGRPPARVELAVYRVAQELVHNSLRHAGASHIDLMLMRQPNRLLLTISDDGVGFDPALARRAGQPGLGLKNIESRLNLIGGRVIFDAAPGKGTYVIVDVPLEG